MEIYFVIGALVLLAAYVLLSYNSLINARNTVEEAFSTMDVYLKKRWDLIPNIVETVKGYAKHEQETLENVVKLRNSAYDRMSQDDKIAVDSQMTGALSKLMAISESYPDLKANQNFLDLSAQLARVEEDIANSRKYYNAVVRNFNNKVQMFPSNIISAVFGFKAVKMFEAAENEKENIQIRF